MKKKKKTWILWLVIGLILLPVLLFCLGNLIVIAKSSPRMVSIGEEDSLAVNADCILVLGCGVHADGSPSDMLRDRMICGIDLYKRGLGKKLLLSGDHGTADYDEVNVMKRLAVEAGVPEEDIFLDHAGFSTYESICRAKEIFCVRRMIVVTQQYHLFRAVYIAETLGIETEGYASDIRRYQGATWREGRECLARVKDIFYAVFQVEPTYLGEQIPIDGDGRVTDG